MNNKYLVTGVAGFIASRVAAMLVEQGDEVVGVDNLNDYYDVSLKQHRLEQLQALPGKRFQFEALDIEDRNGIKRIFDSHPFAAVINLAARAGVRYSMINPHVYMTTNALGSLNLLEEMRQRGVTKYVLASTSSLYAGQPMPFVESLPVNTPISPYAASKKAAEAMAYSYHYLYNIDVTVVRYFTVYGPAGRPDMCIFRFIRWIDEGQPIELFGDGSQSRDFTFVDDIARGTIAAIRPLGYEIVNLGGGQQPITLNLVIEKLERLLGKSAKIENREFHKADIKSTWADIAKANSLLGWSPQVSLDDGLEQCVRWYVDNRPWSQQIVLP
ncbi:MAG TPA: GDP-mannose 4,6-dehydratase [Pirellulaceae bacterium]|nr:GDP-mannose 4,6-dehydratase [Pirellulaceae bacterium]HMO92965.1 GDP-mannose 4,6-dehydratase [Pirellulaceae bacterium]HMP68470.1 GDP-mannose 4,6-dehydratase [Pirellulaceae bacterium]